MRVWMIHQHAYAPDHSASTRHFALGKELVQRGHEVLIIASSFYHKAHRETRLTEGEFYQHETIDGVRYVWLRTPDYQNNGLARLRNMLVFAHRAWRQVGFRSEPPPDVVIGSSPHLFSPWAAMRLARRFRVPFVLEIRDIWPAGPIEMGNVSRWHPLMLWMAHLERTYYRRAERVISVLPFASRHVEACVGHSDHVVWIPNGASMPPVTAPREHNGPLVFMYAGAHSAYGGLDTVLDAAKILQDQGYENRVRLRLVGDGPEKPRLVRRAAELGLRIVSFEDAVPRNEIAARLQEADAFLMVCHAIGVHRWGISPNKLFDYMAAARPVLYASAAPGNPIVASEAGITVAPEDPQDLARGIIELCETPWHSRAAMGQRARTYVEQHHSFSRLGQQLEEALLEVAVTQPNPRRQAA